jgi:mRNA interferase MazF
MIYNPFSVVIVPFPFTDKIQTKRRPALVLSSPRHQKETGHITLLMITSAKHSLWESDYQIKDLHAAGLHSASIIRQKIFTIDIRLIIESAGKLNKEEIKKINNITSSHLAIK